MTIRHLKTFLAVYDCGGMSAAARKLYIAQPTVSQAIAEMENHYGGKLFERLGKKLYLTARGRALLPYARYVVALLDKMEVELRGSERQQTIVLGATLTVGEAIMPTLVNVFRKNFPEVQCRVIISNTDEVEKMLLANELDIAIVEGAIKSREIFSERLQTDEVILACGQGHYLAKKGTLSISDLENEEFLVREKGSGTRALFAKEMLLRDISWQAGWECSASEIIIKAAQLGLGIAVISKSLIKEELKDKTLIRLNFTDISFERTYNLIYHKNKYITEGMRNFILTCHQLVQEN